MDWKAKFGSRKFLLTAVSVVSGIVFMLTSNDGLAQLVAQIGGIMIPIIVYVAVEGKIDAQKILQSGIEIMDLFDDYKDDASTEEAALPLDEIKPEVTE